MDPRRRRSIGRPIVLRRIACLGVARLASWMGRAGTCLMSPPPRILALLTDGYGARGGIARYNQDLFDSLAGDGVQVFIVPRAGDVTGIDLPRGIRQAPAALGRLRYAARAFRSAWRCGPFDAIFCGHLYMA